MVLSWLAATLCLAAPPELGVLATGALGSGPDEEPSWYGGQLSVQQPIGRFAIGGRVMGGGLSPGDFTDTGLHLAIEPVARVWFSDPSRPAVSALIGAGVSIESGVQGIVSAGAALDLGRRRGFRPRIEGGYHLQPGPGRWRLSLSAGFAWQRPPPPEPVVVEPPPPEPVKIEEGLVWIPEPVCDWVPYDEAAARSEVEPTSVWDSEGRRPYGESTEASSPDPSLVVAAWPGDEVLVGGAELPTDDRGLAVGHPLPGVVAVFVRGGGRVEELEAVIPDEHALWLAIRPPEPVRVTFPVDVAELDDAARAVVAEVIGNRSDWAFEVRGSHSLEGDPDRNATLATLRARAVADALRKGGVPRSKVILSEALDVAGSDAPPEELRAAVIYPLLEDQP